MPETRRAVIYARSSSDKQSERSIDDQVALCRVCCEREGLLVSEVYDDRAISGASTANRIGWLRLMRDASAGKFDVVIAEALDRISRDQEDLAGIYKRLRFMQIELRIVQDGKAEEIHVGVKGLLGALYLKDLAQKTKRGQAGVIRDQRHNGGRSYGYRSVPGKPGRREIVEVEASVVRRIFDRYAAGRSPRDIAAANREGVPGPRGGPWNASTVAGSRKRANGILQNALYIGRIVWNRQSFIKDPDTGRRVSRPNPESERMTAETPELRIVTDDVWTKVQARKARRSGERTYATRPRHLLSGLLKCDHCGSGYVVSGRDKRGLYLRCSRMVETGLCDNKRTVALDDIETRVIGGIEKHLASPDLIAEYVREYQRAWAKLRDSTGKRRAELQKQFADVQADIRIAVDVLLEKPSRAVRERLDALEEQRDRLEGALAEVQSAADSYRKKVQDLRAALAAAEDENRQEAYRGIRENRHQPTGPYKPVDLEIHGRMATLLRASIEETIEQPKSMGALVAGVGFEPTTFRL
jgi:site-specific DNA recombinase